MMRNMQLNVYSTESVISTWYEQKLGILCLVGELGNNIRQGVKGPLHYLSATYRATQRLGDKRAHQDVQRLAAVVLEAGKDALKLLEHLR